MRLETRQSTNKGELERNKLKTQPALGSNSTMGEQVGFKVRLLSTIKAN